MDKIKTMTEEIKFGIPTQRTRSASKKDLYSFGPAITIMKNEGHRTSKRIVINPSACELLNLDPWSEDQKVSFSFTTEDPIIVNTTELTLPKGQFYKIAAKKDVAGLVIKDSKLWSYLVKTYNLNETANNSFELVSKISESPLGYSFIMPITESLKLTEIEPVSVAAEDASDF